MDLYRIRTKLASLVRLAERPGTPAEGEVARLTAIRLAAKHGLTCAFSPGPSSTTRVVPEKPPEENTKAHPADVQFFRWTSAMAELGWTIYECKQTKIGRLIKFRKPGFASEVQITQRKRCNGEEFEVEHIMRPDPENGVDRSFTAFTTISLRELMQHLAYTK